MKKFYGLWSEFDDGLYDIIFETESDAKIFAEQLHRDWEIKEPFEDCWGDCYTTHTISVWKPQPKVD